MTCCLKWLPTSITARPVANVVLLPALTAVYPIESVSTKVGIILFKYFFQE